MTPDRVLTIEGHKVRVIERAPPIPGTLEVLLEGGRDGNGRFWAPLRIISRQPLRLGGPRPECLREDHRLGEWLEGFHTGSDQTSRHLALLACSDCGAVQVRDRSFDSIDNLPTGRLPLRRRDHLIGWYSGSRPRQRVYT
jgi:hypothetical protein